MTQPRRVCFSYVALRPSLPQAKIIPTNKPQSIDICACFRIGTGVDAHAMPSMNRWLRGQRSNGGLPADDAPKRRHSPFVVLAVKLEQSCGISGRASSEGSSRQCNHWRLRPARPGKHRPSTHPSGLPPAKRPSASVGGNAKQAGSIKISLAVR